MEQEKKLRLPPIGLRMVKTMLSAAIVLILYGILDRNACFACIGAVYGMGSVLREGRHSGGNRFIGTFVGGLIALPFYLLYHNETWGVPGWVWMTLGLFCVLYTSQLLGVNGSIQPGTVVFYVVILTVPQSRYLTYTLARIIDTGVGVALSLAISYFWPSERDRAARLKSEIAEEEAELAADKAALAELEQDTHAHR